MFIRRFMHCSSMLVFMFIVLVTSVTALAAEDCGLSVNKQCQVIVPDPGVFDCGDAKPIDSLTMIWNGLDNATIKAWKGSVGGTLLAEIADVDNGEEITVGGMGGSPNDQVWEIFYAGSKFGESVFHISCSDDNMNGPEDCKLPLGDGKSDDSSYLNQWLFEGMAGSGQTLDCTPIPPAPTDNCEFEASPRPGCDALGKPNSLTFVYTGEACDPSSNDQGSKTGCSDFGTLGEPATISSTNSGLTISPDVVYLDDEFTISGSFGSATVLTLDTPNGAMQELNIHTSCSAPLAAGDGFGGLTLVEFNGQQGGTDVNYFYTVSNGDFPVYNLTVDDDLLGPIGGQAVLAANDEALFTASAVINETTTNKVVVQASLDQAGLLACDPPDDETTVKVKETCDVCKGGVTDLLLMYAGNDSNNVVVYDDSDDKPDKILFEGFVGPNDEIPISPLVGEDKLNGTISIWVNGSFHASLHTSCSQPVGPGIFIGDFEIIKGYSKDNGLMCPLNTCDVGGEDLEFYNEELRLEISNFGDADVVIDRILIQWPEDNGNLVEIKREGDTIHEGTFSSGMADISSGWEGDQDDRTIEYGKTDELKFKFDYDAIFYGDYSVTVEFNQGCSVTKTFTALPETCDVCKGGVRDLLLSFSGSSGNVVVYDDSDPKADKILFAGSVTTGDEIPLQPRVGQDKLAGTISFYVNGAFNASLHTSCSQPVGPNLVLGDFVVVSGHSKDNGLMCPLNTCDVQDQQAFEYDGDELRYPITNNGDAHVVIDNLTVNWVNSTAGDLNEVKLDGSKIQEGAFMPPSVSFSSVWEGDVNDRRIDSGDSALIKLKFENPINLPEVFIPISYEVIVQFDQGCQVSYKDTLFNSGD